MNDETVSGPLSGRHVALLETREADRFAAMLREQGAEIIACPAVAIVDLADPTSVMAWLHRFIAEPSDDLILLTGEGVYRLQSLARRAGVESAFVAALHKTRTISRGPKPGRALRALGLQPQLRAELPTTDGVIALLSNIDLRGRRVGVQLYPGAADSRLVGFLQSAGAVPDPVTPYDYGSQAADEAIAALINELAAGTIDLIAFTSAPQIRRLFEVAKARSRADQLFDGLHRTVIAAIGPVVAEELQRRGLKAAIMPNKTYFMKPLVSAIVARFSS
jgi:uroporphyrinogen-III synthase